MNNLRNLANALEAGVGEVNIDLSVMDKAHKSTKRMLDFCA